MGGRRVKIGIAAAVMACGFFYAVLSSMKGPEAVVYSYSVAQFLSSTGSLDGIPTRVSGKVVAGSILRDMESSQVRFRIADATGAQGILDVVYPRMSTPDAFKDDAEVMLEGTFSGQRGSYLAKQLFTKCPSKYEAKAKGATAASSKDGSAEGVTAAGPPATMPAPTDRPNGSPSAPGKEAS